MYNARKFLALKRAIRRASSAEFLLLRKRPTFVAARLVCLAGDVALHAPVEIAVG
jgi:hypothetical protein